jgi:hypothetical protein
MAIVRGFLRLAGTFLIAGAGLLVVVGLVAAVRSGEPQLILVALPIVPLWLAAGLLMTTSLVTEACWDEESLCLALAYETKMLTWSEILRARAVTVHVWPMPGEAVFILLKYRRPVSGRAKSAWALLALSSERLSSWPSAHIALSLPRRDPERN